MKKISLTLMRLLLWTTACIAILVILVVAALYTPVCQDIIFRKAVNTLNNSGSGMHVGYGRLRLKFPANISGEQIMASLPGDMEIAISEFDGGIALLPLIKGDLKSDGIKLSEVKFRMGTPDSSLYMNAAVNDFKTTDIEFGLKSGKVKVGDGLIDGADVTLLISENDTTATDTAASSGTPLDIVAERLELRKLKYHMQLPPTIDSLNAEVGDIVLTEGHVNLNNREIEAHSLDVTGVDASYIYSPTDSITEAVPTDTAATPDSLMWTVRATNIRLEGKRAKYALNGAAPSRGFDMDYIEATDIAIVVDSFYNRGASIEVPLKKLEATERSGLRLEATGLFEIADGIMSAKGMKIRTNASEVSLDAIMGLTGPGKRAADCPISADISSRFAMSDIGMAFPSASDILMQLPTATELKADISTTGTMAGIIVKKADISLTRLLEIRADGNASGFDQGIGSLTGDLNINGRLTNTKLIKPSIVEAKLGKGVTLHPMSLRGHMKMRRGTISSDIKVLSDSGIIAFDGEVNIGPEVYSAEINTRQFPIQAFMPAIGIENLSVSVTASGKKFNPLAESADMTGHIDLRHVVYNKKIYSDIHGNITLSDGIANVSLKSPVKGADISIDANGNVTGPNYKWNFSGSINDFDLKQLNMSPTPLGGRLSFDGNASFNPDSMLIDAKLNIPSLEVTMDETVFGTKNIGLDFNANTESTHARLTNQDLRLNIDSRLSLDSLLKRITLASSTADSSIVTQRIEFDRIAQQLPPFKANLSVGPKNIIAAFLSKKGTSLKSLQLTLANDSALNMNGVLQEYVTPTTIVDTMRLALWQKSDAINFMVAMNNRPESPGNWADVNLTGVIEPSSLSANFTQKDFNDKIGFELGADASWLDSVIYVHLTPEHPVIGYKEWGLNTDNFIRLDLSKKTLDADLALSNSVSSVRFYTQTATDSLGDKKTINLSAKDIMLQEWITLNPYAPPIKGSVSGDISVFHRGDTINGNANVRLSDFFYGKGRVGDFRVLADIETQPRGYIRAKGGVDVNDNRVVTVSGHINDTTAAEPFMLDMRVDSMPLAVANPFLSDAGLKLSGLLDGNMKVTGEMTSPTFNGYVSFDSASVKVNMLGTEYALSDNKIAVDSGIIVFDKFNIKGVNENPLVVDGTVNMHNISNPAIDLALNAKNMQIIGSDRARGGAEVFGKAFVDFNATARGNMELMKINADVNVLRNTNATYILTDATQTLSSRSQSDIVKFVNFADTLQVEQADSIKPTGMLLGIDANLQIQPGVTVQVYLSGDGKNRVSVQPQGNLDYNMDLMGAQSVTGRLMINSGFARYTPPLMGEKLFNIQEGSYVAFNGNMMNPSLNIRAVDNVKANVTQTGQSSRLIYFDVSLAVSGTLEQMDVKFDLSTKDDITVENELSSMSPEQRASAAMNLLITNMYTGPGTTATSNIGGNALYSFLESQINSWAANNIKGVDLSFGVNQYDSTNDGSTSQTTSYSYRVSKSLFDNRFKIVVGGNYTTDADNDENFSENLINDIAFEYVLNKSGSMTLKLFRHTGYESILEGEVTQTGVGLTYRKRMTTLGQMFWFMRARYRRQMKLLEEQRKAQLEKEAAESPSKE